MRKVWLAPVVFFSSFCFAQQSGVGLAAFNMAWAGNVADFSRHYEVCSHPAVNWCNSRARIPKGAKVPTPAEKIRAEKCQASFDLAAGGVENGMLVAPCNAYKLNSQTALAIKPSDYQQKLDGLTQTIDSLIKTHTISLFAFQEVRSEDVIRTVLGQHSSRFGVCVAPHNAFQTVAFAWERTLAVSSNPCREWTSLAIKEDLVDLTSSRRLRPGLSIDLQIGQSKFSVLNVHLKSSCANLITSKDFEGHLLTDDIQSCQVLNRQVVPLEDAIEQISATSPNFVVMGDFNRRLDEEENAKPAISAIRLDGSHPATSNTIGLDGRTGSKYMWQEISDGNPGMVQVPLEINSPCKGFIGLDHILVSKGLWALQAPGTVSKKMPAVTQANQKLETSDHCPRYARLVF